MFNPNIYLDQNLTGIIRLLPELCLVAGLLLSVFIEILPIKAKSLYHKYLILLSLLAAFYTLHLQSALIFSSHEIDLELFGGLLLQDKASLTYRFWILVFALFTWVFYLLFSVKDQGFDLFQVEYAAAFLLLTAALCLGTMAIHFVSLMILLETVSIISYGVVALNKDKGSLEGAFQYLIFGGISSAFMLFGFSVLFGVTGQMHFGIATYADLLKLQDKNLIVTAGILAFSGAFFKLALVPFHAWVPKIFSATPTAWLAYLSTAPKLLGLLVLLRLQSSFNYGNQQMLAVIALASLIIGTLAALRQSDARQMLGFSTIAHGGFIILGAILPSYFGYQSASFYAITYGLIAFAAFFMVELLKTQSGSCALESFSGLGGQSTIFGVCIVLIAIALVGLPPTVGFSGKFLIFSNLYQVFEQTKDKIYLVLLIIGLLNAAISLFFYLKIPYYLFLKKGEKTFKIDFFQGLFLLGFTISILFLFFRSDLLLKTLQY